MNRWQRLWFFFTTVGVLLAVAAFLPHPPATQNPMELVPLALVTAAWLMFMGVIYLAGVVTAWVRWGNRTEAIGRVVTGPTPPYPATTPHQAASRARN